MRLAFGLVFLIVGNLAFITGGRQVLTGKNLNGLLGRGFTRSDDLRMQRAPAVYFRAMGSMILSLGLLVVWVGIAFLTTPDEPSSAYLVTIFGIAGLLLGFLIASTGWLTVVAAKHRLFRWDKP